MKTLPFFAQIHPLADRARFELFLNVFVRGPQPLPTRRTTRKRR
jgi:hypothetical protein